MNMMSEQLEHEPSNLNLLSNFDKSDLLDLIKEAAFDDLVMVVAKDGQRWAKHKGKGYFMYRGVTVKCQIKTPGELDLLLFDLASKHGYLKLNEEIYESIMDHFCIKP